MAKMTKLERAKIFMPFDALKCFREALKAKEEKIITKKEFNEDYLEELDNKLKMAHLGQIIKIVYYQNNTYLELSGVLTKIDYINKEIRIIKKIIKAKDIITFEIISSALKI